MSRRDEDLRLRPGRVRDRPGAGQAKSFVGQVLRAAKAAGHSGDRFSGPAHRGRSSFGRGRFAAAARSLSHRQRRVVVKARVVRHRGPHGRAAPLARHLAYLTRDGVARDGRQATLFDRDSDATEARGFAARCADDRHHFRFIVSPEDAAGMTDLRGFTRDLMARATRDLGTGLDWVAVYHWNTGNPHVHVLVRGRTDTGADLVIARDYIARGLRERAEALVSLELGPRRDHEIANALAAEVTAERWTGLDRTLCALADDNAGVVDLRPGSPEPRGPELRRLLLGRVRKLERLGLADTVAPAVWALKPEAETTLRDLALRGDIVRTMHRAMADGPARPLADFAIEDVPEAPILGRLVERGLHDELTGEACAIIDGIDGRVHHLRFADLEATGDTAPGGIVETRTWGSEGRRARLALVGRSDLTIEAQVRADGATWLDRLQLARDPAPLWGAGFGAEVRAALADRVDHLAALGLARRQGQRVVFARDLLATLRARELDATEARIAAETGLPRYRPGAGDLVSGTFRRRLDLASGRFAMIEGFGGDGGLGFALVPWTPTLERALRQIVTGTMTPGGGVDWTLGRKRGLGI